MQPKPSADTGVPDFPSFRVSIFTSICAPESYDETLHVAVTGKLRQVAQVRENLSQLAQKALSCGSIRRLFSDN
jgi:hypothetical protein